MTDEEIRDTMTDLLYDQLSDDEAMALRKAIAEDDELQKEYDAIKRLVIELRELPLRRASAGTHEKFEHWLERQIVDTSTSKMVVRRSKVLNIWKYGIAASIVLAIGFFIGQEFIQKNQVLALEQESKSSLLQLVVDESTTGRIAGINKSKGMKILDPEIKTVLLSILENDKSTNVRLAALDALAIYIDDPMIKSKFIQVLKKDTQPIVQISLINALANFKEYDVKKTLEELVGQQDLSNEVRDEAILNITRL